MTDRSYLDVFLASADSPLSHKLLEAFRDSVRDPAAGATVQVIEDHEWRSRMGRSDLFTGRKKAPFSLTLRKITGKQSPAMEANQHQVPDESAGVIDACKRETRRNAYTVRRATVI
jgi:hypothetical protein